MAEYIRYLVKGGKVAEIIEDFRQQLNAAFDAAEPIQIKYRAAGVYYRHGAKPFGLRFNSDPGAPWVNRKKDPSECWTPDSRTKDGKAIAAEFRALPAIPGNREFAKLLGGGDCVTATHWLTPYYQRFGDQYVLSIPVNPKSENQFVPPDEVEELKLSEYYRLKEEAEAAKAAPTEAL